MHITCNIVIYYNTYVHCARVGVLFKPTPFAVFKRDHYRHCEVPRVTVNRVRSRNSILYYDGLRYIESWLLTIVNNIITGTEHYQPKHYLRRKFADFRKPLSTGCVIVIYIYFHSL